MRSLHGHGCRLEVCACSATPDGHVTRSHARRLLSLLTLWCVGVAASIATLGCRHCVLRAWEFGFTTVPLGSSVGNKQPCSLSQTFSSRKEFVPSTRREMSMCVCASFDGRSGVPTFCTKSAVHCAGKMTCCQHKVFGCRSKEATKKHDEPFRAAAEPQRATSKKKKSEPLSSVGHWPGPGQQVASACGSGGAHPVSLPNFFACALFHFHLFVTFSCTMMVRRAGCDLLPLPLFPSAELHDGYRALGRFSRRRLQRHLHRT